RIEMLAVHALGAVDELGERQLVEREDVLDFHAVRIRQPLDFLLLGVWKSAGPYNIAVGESTAPPRTGLRRRADRIPVIARFPAKPPACLPPTRRASGGQCSPTQRRCP